MKNRKAPKPLTRRELEVALLRLFKEDRAIVPRCVMTARAYDVAWHMWSRTKQGRAELRKVGR